MYVIEQEARLRTPLSGRDRAPSAPSNIRMPRREAMPGLVATLLLLPVTAAAQAAQRFEAVSIKPNLSGAEGSDTTTTTGRLNLLNATALSLVQRAFGVHPHQILGAPAWVTSDRFDIVAVTGGADQLTDKDRQPFIQALLAERFGFQAHEETREMRAYALVAAKKGVKLVPSTGPGEYAMKRTMESGKQVLRSTKGNLTRLVEILSKVTGRTVMDQTGLTAQYDFTLAWVPDQEGDSTGPSLFTALQEQLGLRLDPIKMPTRVIVIDRMERPSAN